jgi:hypothetical protein
MRTPRIRLAAEPGAARRRAAPRAPVVGVDQQHDVVRLRVGEVLERRDLVAVRLHERVRHGAEHRDPELAAGLDGRRPGEAGEIARACRQQRRLRAVRAPQPEIDEQPIGSSQHAARRLAGDQRTVVQQVHHPALDQLRLADRRDDAQDRLVGEKHGAFRHRVDVAGETQVCQGIDELAAEASAGGQPCEFVGGEVQVREVIDHLGNAGGDEEPPLRRQLAHEELERGDTGHLLLVVRLQHRQLVQIGEQHVLSSRRRSG